MRLLPFHGWPQQSSQTPQISRQAAPDDLGENEEAFVLVFQNGARLILLRLAAAREMQKEVRAFRCPTDR